MVARTSAGPASAPFWTRQGGIPSFGSQTVRGHRRIDPHPPNCVHGLGQRIGQHQRAAPRRASDRPSQRLDCPSTSPTTALVGDCRTPSTSGPATVIAPHRGNIDAPPAPRSATNCEQAEASSRTSEPTASSSAPQRVVIDLDLQRAKFLADEVPGRSPALVIRAHGCTCAPSGAPQLTWPALWPARPLNAPPRARWARRGRPRRHWQSIRRLLLPASPAASSTTTPLVGE